MNYNNNYNTEFELSEIVKDPYTYQKNDNDDKHNDDSLRIPHTDPANPFAFTSEQLVAVVEQKRLDFIHQMGGLHGLAKGLHSNIKKGIAWSENSLSYIRMYDLQQHESKERTLKEEYYDSHLPLSLHDSETFVQRRKVFGSNILPIIEEVTLLQLMWQAFQDKILILLTVSALISLTVGIYEDSTRIEYDSAGNRIPGVRWVEGVAIILAVILVVSVGSVNDYQKEKQFRSLNSKKDDRQVSAIRSGKNIFLSVYDVQVGDILKLEPGEIICADGIFIEGHNVKCDESASTGESEAVRKASWQECYQEMSKRTTTITSIEDEEEARVDPFLISGSKVLEGVCTYLVTAVGPNSWHGRTMMTLRTKNDSTPLQKKLDVLATSIAKCGLTAAAILLSVLTIRSIVSYATGQLTTVPTEIVSHIMQILITTITVIVVAVPEGLPLAVTLALAYATKRMLKDNNLVRILAACETMGNATTICSDKTGTLTQNKMAVVAGTIGSSLRFLKDPPLSRFDLIDAQYLRERMPVPIRNFLNQAIVVNSTASLNTNAMGDVSLVGNKTETALLQFADDYLGCEPFEWLRSSWHVEAVFPFNSAQKAMATVLRIPHENGRFFYRVHLKGASEVLLNHCSHIVSLHDPLYDSCDYYNNVDDYNVQTRVMTGANRERLNQIIQSYATRCLRTITLCYQDFQEWPSSAALHQIMELDQLTFLCIVGIEDALRPGVTNAVAACQNAGVVVRMVTGDNMLTAKSIARQCGIYTQGAIAMDGPTFRKLKPSERDRILPRLRVLARSSPEDKRLLVNALQGNGDIVAVTGDGTNDGPALKAADVGFSMGLSGTEVAKEASSIILMDDNFSSIVHAISWGRCVNDSVKKFLQFQLTINITAVLLTVISAIVSEKQTSILSAVQLLWVNLIMDTFAALALATDAPSLDLLNRLPEQRTAPLIDICMWKMIVFESFYQLGVILTLLYTDVLHLANNTAKSQTVIFTTFVFCQIFNEVNCRRIDNKLNIFKGVKHNKFFILIFSLSVTGQILIVQYGGAAFQTVPLNASMWAFCLMIGLLSIPIGALTRLIPDSFFVSVFMRPLKKYTNQP
ncbi:PMCA-type calcium-translocating P-type ATPase [Mycotypha africana]|uniref:PMCA-type calcium-translocating P-type ATPase n=1 Tax=Mycotypha africana TaxID=64632 RepID=UPI002300ED58|nr:PMCA-type calcium-translocating P-type ATPase [Mycotypha africana]KAI8979786.1 PMCA-type calcium-translocating P-type ATPase [Mycotypha africana]